MSKDRVGKSRSSSKAEKGLNVSGSDWSDKHLKAFAITLKTDRELDDLLGKNESSRRINMEEGVGKLLNAAIGENAQYGNKSHAELFQMAEDANVQLGPFLAFLAVVTEAPKATGEFQLRRSSRIAEKESSKHSDAQAVQHTLLKDINEDPYATPKKQIQSIIETPDQTPQSVAKEQEKAEIVSNTMVVLFLQVILESFRDSISASKNNHLEWHFIPTSLSVATSEAICKCINDGSLFRKHSQRKGTDVQWVNADCLLYASIEVCGKLVPSLPPLQQKLSNIAMI